MMKVIKWEMERTCSDENEKREKLLSEGWEPFGSQNGLLLLRRPTGYIEVEEKEINQEQKTVITKEVKFNLDSLRSNNDSN